MNKSDPSGKCPWCVGALIGVGLEIANQTLIEGKSIDQIDWVDVGISGVAGAIGPGVFKVGGKLLDAELSALRAEKAVAKLEDAKAIGQSSRVMRVAAQVQRAKLDLSQTKNNALKSIGSFAALKAGESSARYVNQTAQSKGYDSAKVNSNGSITAKVSVTGSRIERTVTCSNNKCQ